ncbi:MAG: hypothetical protein E3J87_10780 [Candidatus Cloacimonadota bacterium]|nr:MAG: hypothetical protein E3J87_10780 [Candidatus Cloacimonadota bacterium]
MENQSATFRIYTENKNQDKIEEIISRYFDGFTIYKAEGFWRLQKEKTLIIEILGESDIVSKINSAAREIKSANNQEAVIVQKIKNNNWLV